MSKEGNCEYIKSQLSQLVLPHALNKRHTCANILQNSYQQLFLKTNMKNCESVLKVARHSGLERASGIHQKLIFLSFFLLVHL